MLLDNGRLDHDHWDRPQAFGRQFVIGDTVVPVVGATLTPTTLTLDLRVRRAGARALLDDLDADAGAVTERELADGSIQHVDLAGGSNTYTLTPPTRLRPPRTERDWVVEDIQRERTSADTRTTDATVTFQAVDTRDPDRSFDESGSAGSDDWTFDFNDAGTLVTQRVSATIRNDGTISLDVLWTPQQASVFETTVAAIAGVRTELIPDGSTLTRDTTPNGRQTVTITPPSSASDPAITADDYVVTDWQVNGTNGGDYQAQTTIDTLG